MTRPTTAAAAGTILILLAATSADAKKTWEHPYGPVTVLHEEMDKGDGLSVKIHAAVVDLKDPDVHVVVSSPKYRGMKTSKFAKEMGAQVALNGGFWKLVSKNPIGWVVSGGTPWKDCQPDERTGYLAISKAGRAWIQPPGDNPLPSPEEGYMVIAGMPLIVDGGQVGQVRNCGYVCMAHPRAVVGVSEDGWKLFLVVSEGRVDGSKSIGPREMAEFMIDLGAWRALNLDGGGSATLYVDELGGMLNAPAEGKERSVLNHIGVIIGNPGDPAGMDAGRTGEAPPPVPTADAWTPGAPTGAAVEADAGSDRSNIVFGESDFVPGGEVESPPTVRWVAGIAAGVMAAVLAAIVVCMLAWRRKRAGRSG